MDFNQQLIPPRNLKNPILGTWKIISDLGQKGNSKTQISQEWMGKSLYFTQNNSLIGDYLLENPSYQTKKVASKSYLLYNHQAFPKDFSFKTKDIQVVSITDKKVFFCELIKKNENELILKIFNKSFLVKKVSNTVDERIFSKHNKKSNKNTDIENEDEKLEINTGVLLALRAPNGSNGTEYGYRTLWVSAKNKNITSNIEMNSIIFPRINGFYKMKILRKEDHGREEDFLLLENILTEENTKNKNLSNTPSIESNKKESLYKKINYIGNDYVSIEENSIMLSQDNSIIKDKDSLRMLAVDALSKNKSLKISDILGEAGLAAMKEEFIQLKHQLIGEEDKNSIFLEEESFGLERKMGYWILKGRIHYGKNHIYNFDYNINMIPPKDLVFYNTLSIPWTVVKDHIPSAIDVFTSPNKDIAFVITEEKILIYAVSEGSLSNSPVDSIPLKDGEEVIMAEWATGDYVKSWDIVLDSYLSRDKN